MSISKISKGEDKNTSLHVKNSAPKSEFLSDEAYESGKSRLMDLCLIALIKCQAEEGDLDWKNICIRATTLLLETYIKVGVTPTATRIMNEFLEKAAPRKKS